jgi:hypothetical protein
MCTCRPYACDIEFEPVLFARYDLSVEFARRRRLVRELMAKRWSRLRLNSDAEIVRELVLVCAIEPLELNRQWERLVVEPCGQIEGTGEPCFYFRSFIHFSGDAELWNLSAGELNCPEAEGTVAYYEYVSGVIETTEERARRVFADRIDAVTSHMEAQKQHIAAFKRLKPFAARELVERRRLPDFSKWWDLS